VSCIDRYSFQAVVYKKVSIEIFFIRWLPMLMFKNDLAEAEDNGSQLLMHGINIYE
jgi:hypothetical protein